MRLRVALSVIACVLLTSDASAQATASIAGTVVDASGQSRIEQLRGGVYRVIYTAGLPNGAARGAGADRVVRGHRQRSAQPRVAGGHDHRHRRIAGADPTITKKDRTARCSGSALRLAPP